MRTFRSRGGPFGERPYYTTDDVEQICRTELANCDLLPSSPEPIRIERFIEKRFAISVRYDDLPDGVLGWTKFASKGVDEIVVSRALSEDGSRAAERRVNTTLAHEAGHGLLHGHLFVLQEGNPTLFGTGSDVERQRILCRDEQTSDSASKKRYTGRWWEFQANQAMGALLLPRHLVDLCLTQVFETTGRFGIKRLPPSERESAVRLLARTFEVNPVVARIRIDELYPVGDDAQLTF